MKTLTASNHSPSHFFPSSLLANAFFAFHFSSRLHQSRKSFNRRSGRRPCSVSAKPQQMTAPIWRPRIHVAPPSLWRPQRSFISLSIHITFKRAPEITSNTRATHTAVSESSSSVLVATRSPSLTFFPRKIRPPRSRSSKKEHTRGSLCFLGGGGSSEEEEDEEEDGSFRQSNERFDESHLFSRALLTPFANSSADITARISILTEFCAALHSQTDAATPRGNQQRIPKLMASATLNPVLNPACQTAGPTKTNSPGRCVTVYTRMFIGPLRRNMGLTRQVLCRWASGHFWYSPGNSLRRRSSNFWLSSGWMMCQILHAPWCR
mmetsp:Transcript_56180/g.110007  ORF Transcript_56180/g.110007 Transcript_56180/m.110007 type:complete len:322 (-) Transcript_56180:894-1859(-)